MDISVLLSGGLGHILPIILNRYFLVALYRAGVLGIFHSTFFILLCDLFGFNRCRAPSGKLDSEDNEYERRSRDHTDFLCARCEMGVLYENYGIIGDIIVCTLYTFWTSSKCNHSLSQMNFHVLIYMKFFHLTYYIKSSKGHSRII